jgi:hypothetical protein
MERRRSRESVWRGREYYLWHLLKLLVIMPGATTSEREGRVHATLI